MKALRRSNCRYNASEIGLLASPVLPWSTNVLTAASYYRAISLSPRGYHTIKFNSALRRLNVSNTAQFAVCCYASVASELRFFARHCWLLILPRPVVRSEVLIRSRMS